MEQPPRPNPLPPTPTGPTPSPSPSPSPTKKGPPTAEEILAHYESQGLEPKEASLKAISDLQALFFRAVSSNRNSSSSSNVNMNRKLDNINSRLSILEMKVDSKPGVPQAFAIGLASGSFFSAIPHLARIWDSVKSATNSSSSS